jgi:hypothetical protein
MNSRKRIEDARRNVGRKCFWRSHGELRECQAPLPADWGSRRRLGEFFRATVTTSTLLSTLDADTEEEEN